ncbi:MAG: ATP-binding protein [Chitinophagaceae bacterium]|nr:ATP-binding protein [Chitinophagaceae bacterium]
MDMNTLNANAATLTREMAWLAEVIGTRTKLFYGQDCPYASISEVPAPDLSDDPSIYGTIVRHYRMSLSERIILLLALAPHLQPHLLDVFFTRNADYDRGFTEFGGIKGQNHGGFLPTGETAAFILAADSLEKRFSLLDLFGMDHFFHKFNILTLVRSQMEEPLLSGMLRISTEYLTYFTKGGSHHPDFSIHFPAKRIHTELDWSGLVLDEDTLQGVQEISDWLQFGNTLLHEWGMWKKIKPGFRALFHGPPGTGKTFTATLLGKSAGLDVYRIDLSMVVSKYIGETEKNLSGVFDQAEHKNWILFFDEADALFGRRTQTTSAHDRYANQEVSYLLQRMEDFPGVVILATNLKTNLDEAFSRRFQSMIYFPMPGPDQRLQLWQQSFPERTVLEDQEGLTTIAEKYEMTGGAIINVTRYASLLAVKRGTNVIRHRDILAGIRKEFSKEGKTIR